MNWASNFSKKHFIPCHMFKYLSLVIRAFLHRKEAVLAICEKRYGITLPRKTGKNTFLLEEIASLLPEKTRERKILKELIKIREHIVACLRPFYRQVALDIISKKLGAQNTFLLDDPRIEETIYKAAVRALDRMKIVGIRIDFLGSYIEREIEKFKWELQAFFSLDQEENSEEILFSYYRKTGKQQEWQNW